MFKNHSYYIVVLLMKGSISISNLNGHLHTKIISTYEHGILE